MSKSHVFKVIIGGDGGVGKTTLLYRYVNGRFLADTKMTVGVEFFQKEVQISEDIEAQLLLWDFAGQAQFRAVIKNYVSGAVGAFLLFDLTRAETLTSLGKWVETFKVEDPNLPILLVGAKFDLEDSIMVKDDDAQEIVKEFKLLGYFKTSSKTGFNVNETFKTLTKEIFKSKNIDL
jgi:small GTP-binding protein